MGELSLGTIANLAEILVIEGLREVQGDGITLLCPVLPDLEHAEYQAGDDTARANDLGKIGNGTK